MSNLASDWPVYIMVIGMIGFFVFVVIKSKQEEKKNKEKQDKQKGNK